jgi:hypothetical protein
MAGAETLLHITLVSNRILLSEETRRRVFNAFRDLKGFNYRDYGVNLVLL